MKSFDSCLKGSNKNSFLSPITKVDIENLSTLKHKSSSPSSIHNKILKSLKKYFSKPISDLINLSFLLGIFPKVLKQAKTVISLKKEVNISAKNTHPSQFYPISSKIIEKVIDKLGFVASANSVKKHI